MDLDSEPKILFNSYNEMETNRVLLKRKPFNRKESQFARYSIGGPDDESQSNSSDDSPNMNHQNPMVQKMRSHFKQKSKGSGADIHII